MNPGDGKTIFWAKGQVVIFDSLIFPDHFGPLISHQYLYCPCLFSGRNYGHFAQTEKFKIYWRHQASEIECPKEFKASLLLMGVPI